MDNRKQPFGPNPTPEQIKAVLNLILATNKDALLAMPRHATAPPPAARTGACQQ